jgi:FAD/FMN-containing dehydrogenases
MGIAAESIGAPWAADAGSMIYLEDDAGENRSVEDVLSAWLALAEELGALVDEIRVFEGAQPLRDARSMRHSVPATMNERGSAQMQNGGRKISTDWAVPYPRLREALAISEAAIIKRGAPMPVTYGHAGNGHPHQNFIAENPEAIKIITEAIEETLKQVILMGGTFQQNTGSASSSRRGLAFNFRNARST